MKQLIKLITKYSIILAVSALIGTTWFYLKSIVMPIEGVNDVSFWHKLPSYSEYFFKVLISILLLIDIRKFDIRYYLIPVVGLFYPLLGVCGLLILVIYNDIKRPVHNNG